MANGKTNWKDQLPPIAGMVILAGCIIGFLIFSGKDLSVEQCLLIVGGVAAVFGFGVRAIRNGGSNGGAAAAGAILIVAASLFGGCAANPCLAERSTVAALGIAVELADEAIPPGVEGRETAIEGARAAVDMGAAAVDGCEALRDDSDWRIWLGIGVSAIKAVLDLVDAHGIDLPDNVAALIREVEAEIQGG
jgi:hypothetical protein